MKPKFQLSESIEDEDKGREMEFSNLVQGKKKEALERKNN